MATSRLVKRLQKRIELLEAKVARSDSLFHREIAHHDMAIQKAAAMATIHMADAWRALADAECNVRESAKQLDKLSPIK